MEIVSVYTDLLLVAAVTIYVVDLSGFTDSWRRALARLMHIREENLRPLPPFDCGKCATWWVCLGYAAFNWGLTLPIIAYSALLSFLSLPIGQALIFIKEWALWLIDKLMPKQ